MSNHIQAIRGMNDLLPCDSGIWQRVETVIQNIAINYGYKEIRTPALEQTNLFKRTIGETTDIVNKEMYSFEDRNGDFLSLRPEGTAGCVRACIQHSLIADHVQKIWYYGPFYRRERPQKGRYRQFYQLGLEAFGTDSPTADAELIALSARIFKTLGLEKKVFLEINSIGSNECRCTYNDCLTQYFEKHKQTLDEDSLHRLSSNPLRILDSKNPEMKSIIEAAPKIVDCLDDESKAHFEKLCSLLDTMGIAYTIKPTLVRGLDYYNRTVFEWTTNELGAQGTVCAGGRYDNLVAMLGGKATPAVGFALGLERLILLMQSQESLPQDLQQPEIFVIISGEKANQQALNIIETLRDQAPSLNILMNCGGGSFKSQFKKADKSGANIALILGDDEIEKNIVTLKWLRTDREQQSLSLEQAIALLTERH